MKPLTKTQALAAAKTIENASEELLVEWGDKPYSYRLKKGWPAYRLVVDGTSKAKRRNNGTDYNNGINADLINEAGNRVAKVLGTAYWRLFYLRKEIYVTKLRKYAESL